MLLPANTSHHLDAAVDVASEQIATRSGAQAAGPFTLVDTKRTDGTAVHRLDHADSVAVI